MRHLTILLLIFALIGCKMDLTGFVRFPEKLSDQRFNGSFTYDISGSVYGGGIATYKFDGTNYMSYHRFQYYASGSKSSYSGYEIEVSNGLYRERLWENEYSSWSDWEDYHFDDEGDLWISSRKLKRS